MAQQSPDTILASLTGHRRRKLEPLAETLAATLDAESLCQLRGHLQACDDASALVADQDRRTAAAVAPWQAQLDLLQTIPGIDWPNACTLLAEIGPTPAQDGPDAAPRPASAGPTISPPRRQPTQ